MNDDLDRDQKFVGKLTEIILANLGNENFGVSELVKQAGTSHFVLSRKLHQTAGKTISQFIRETRLKKALEMLQGGDITAAEVAYKTGFGSPTYFNTCFNEFYGFPPGTVKKGEYKINNETKVFPDIDKQKQKGKILLASSLLIIAALVLILGYHIFTEDSADGAPDRSGIQEKSIAVLPFKNLSDSAGNQYFADGITEDILTLLSRINDLRVISRTSVEQFRNSKLSASEIAKQLKVKYIIEGSVQKSGDMFRLWIQLIDAIKGVHLWAEVYDGQYSTDIFDFQSSVAKKVAASLNAVISPAEEQKIDINPTSQILAYDLSKKGHDFIRKWDLEGERQFLELALNSFEEALKIDPDYVAALLGKAQALVKSGAYDSSKVYCKKVLAIDKENADALGALGGYYLYTVNPDSALLYFQKSIASNINNEKCFWNYLAAGQVYLCQKDEVINALISFQKAYDTGGNSWPEIHENISLLFSALGDRPKAFKYMQNALSMTSGCLYVQKSFSILLAGEKYDEAIHFIDSIARITPCEQNCDIMRFHLFTVQKKFDTADMSLKRAINSGYKLLKDDYFYKYCLDVGAGRESEDIPKLMSIVTSEESLLKTGKSYWMSETALRVAAGYAILGDNRQAMTYLKIAEKNGFADISFPLRTYPGFDNLRSEPEFKAIMQRIEDNRISLRAQVKEMELRGEIVL